MRSVLKVGSRANIHLTSDKRVFGEIVSATDEYVEILEKRRDRPTSSIVYINYANITCVYPEEAVAEAETTAPAAELKVESPGGAGPAPPSGPGPVAPPSGPGPVTPPGGGETGTPPAGGGDPNNRRPYRTVRTRPSASK